MGRVTNDPDLYFWFEDEEEDMGFNYYMDEAAQTAIYKQEYQIVYPALGLAAEAGEVANKVKKIIRDGELDHNSIVAELGDCLWYLAALCRDLNVDMADVAAENLQKLQGRMERGTLAGSGDNR